MENINNLAMRLADMIKGYRAQDAIPMNQSIDYKHVLTWVSQFDEAYQIIILQEMIHILGKCYFQKSDFLIFAEAIIEYYEEHGLLEQLQSICLLNSQEGGSRSQTICSDIFSETFYEHFGTIPDSKITTQEHYIYIDDGIYTGRQTVKEVKKLIHDLPSGACVNLFFFLAYEEGLQYAQSELSGYAKKYNITILINRWKCFNNLKRRISNEKGQQIMSAPNVLWVMEENEAVSEIERYSADSGIDKKYYWFRREKSRKEGIFSSEYNRNILETQFVKKGIEIYNSVLKTKGMMPLGFDKYPGLGFGAMCVTEFNIANNCPLVLWADKIIGTQYEAIDWYPLFPRRRRHHDVPIEPMLESYPDYYTYTYNVCPTCGCKIGYFNDGGNGFCIDCAWDK